MRFLLSKMLKLAVRWLTFSLEKIRNSHHNRRLLRCPYSPLWIAHIKSNTNDKKTRHNYRKKKTIKPLIGLSSSRQFYVTFQKNIIDCFHLLYRSENFWDFRIYFTFSVTISYIHSLWNLSTFAKVLNSFNL